MQINYNIDILIMKATILDTHGITSSRLSRFDYISFVHEFKPKTRKLKANCFWGCIPLQWRQKFFNLPKFLKLKLNFEFDREIFFKLLKVLPLIITFTLKIVRFWKTKEKSDWIFFFWNIPINHNWRYFRCNVSNKTKDEIHKTSKTYF